jgi:hypothetical protein
VELVPFVRSLRAVQRWLDVGMASLSSQLSIFCPLTCANWKAGNRLWAVMPRILWRRCYCS